MSEQAVKIKKRRKKERFTQISNKALRDKRMSLAVRGFFALMYSLPEDDEHSVSYYLKTGGISRDTFYSYIKVLEEFGYLTREQTHQSGGKFGVNVYTLDDEPCPTFPDTVKPDTVEPDTEKPDADKYYKGINTPPIVPQGDKSAGESVCTWKPERFLAFWEYYRDTFCAEDHSRAGERAAAALAWDKLKPDDVMLQKIARKLQAIMRTQQWKDSIGIKWASTFLNGIRLKKIDLDELPPPAADKSTAKSTPRRYVRTEIIDGKRVDVYE